MKKLRIGVIGCGVISDIYLKNLASCDKHMEVAACADRHPEKSADLANRYNIRVSEPDALLQDPNIDVILNLTTPRSHAPVTLAALENGKHVYSEKPLAITMDEGRRIMERAAAKSLQVGCAPDTFLGASHQTAIKAIADGWIGNPLAASAFFTCPGHEKWHVNPDFYYQEGGGPVLDNAPYFLAVLIAMLGPVKKVSAIAGRGFKTRTIGAGPRKGAKIPVDIDTHVSASLEMRNGAIVTTMWSFDIAGTRLPFLEVYGSKGTFSLPAPSGFDGKLLYRGSASQEFVDFPLCFSHSGNQRGLGLSQMCYALLHGGEFRASGTFALHVLDVMCAIEASAKKGITVECGTTCPVPAALDVNVPMSEWCF